MSSFTQAVQTFILNRSKQSSETNTDLGGFKRTKLTQNIGLHA